MRLRGKDFISEPREKASYIEENSKLQAENAILRKRLIQIEEISAKPSTTQIDTNELSNLKQKISKIDQENKRLKQEKASLKTKQLENQEKIDQLEESLSALEKKLEIDKINRKLSEKVDFEVKLGILAR